MKRPEGLVGGMPFFSAGLRKLGHYLLHFHGSCNYYKANNVHLRMRPVGRGRFRFSKTYGSGPSIF